MLGREEFCSSRIVESGKGVKKIGDLQPATNHLLLKREKLRALGTLRGLGCEGISSSFLSTSCLELACAGLFAVRDDASLCVKTYSLHKNACVRIISILVNVI